ncbi:hypothetical protein A9Z42_0032850 [Trichoderma parareesei]|uniref:Uncharacterized protein n=1 Tax=Trichoderma parareesei TaxID=858221 RepID=A0A2H2Z9U1_TRIPA|nr:hypothetical protein A9Z42_0032850 [Trichoderma parareesei]
MPGEQKNLKITTTNTAAAAATAAATVVIMVGENLVAERYLVNIFDVITTTHLQRDQLVIAVPRSHIRQAQGSGVIGELEALTPALATRLAMIELPNGITEI